MPRAQPLTSPELDQRWVNRIDRAARRLVRAEVADSWKGGGDPADVPGIEAEVQEARRVWAWLLKDLRGKP